MIKAEIIKDSINIHTGDRLTTWILEYPRFIHSELLTHRVFSKNSASSRAIPTNKIIKDIIKNPAMPIWWGKNQSGMQAKEELEDYLIEDCKFDWLRAMDSCIERSQYLSKRGLHKQIANRILEPWFNMRVILSGTEYDNFFLLRAHPDAQPEFQKLAYLMLEKYNESIPEKLNVGEWHIPFGDNLPIEINRKDQIKIAIARCARVSYLRLDGTGIDLSGDIELYNRLTGSNPKHLSPTEHIAEATAICDANSPDCANFRGWRQYRSLIDDIISIDPRIKKYKS